MYFSAYVGLLKKRDRLDEKIGRLEGNLYFVHPSTISDMPRGTLRGTDGVTDDLYKLFELREERDILDKKLEEIRKKYDISKIEYDVVRQRNVLEKHWKEIAKLLGYSVRHVQRIYNGLLQKFS